MSSSSSSSALPLDYPDNSPSTTNLVNGISTPVVAGTTVGTTVAPVASVNPSLTQNIFIIYKLDPTPGNQPAIEKIYISFLNNGSNTYVAQFEYDQTTKLYASSSKQICIGACTRVDPYVPSTILAPVAINPAIKSIKNAALNALTRILNPAHQ